MSQYVLGVDGGGTKTNAVILDEHALCWLLRSSARIFGIKRVEVGVSCCVLFYTYLKFHWERHGQIPFLASRTHQTLDKTCHPVLVSGVLSDLSRSRMDLVVENALLCQ